MSRPRLFFWVQHLLGIGHLRRAAALARAVADDGFAVTIASGGPPVPELDLGPVELVQLPPARATDSSFATIVDENGRRLDDAWWTRRRAALLAAFVNAQPDVVLIELYPFGRRAFRAELTPLLDDCAAARPRVPVAVSLRDILVEKGRPDRVAETVRIVRAQIGRVLVHGDPALFRLDETFPAAAEIADRISYTGYVVNRLPPPVRPTGEVLVSAGGGVVGRGLLECALAARKLTRLAGAPWRLVTGPQLPDADLAAIRAQAARMENVSVDRYRPDFQALLAGCTLSVSQAGYNTLMEILAAGTRAVVVPFAEAGETEQTLRARRLAERGLVGLVEADALSPSALAAAIDAAAARPAARGPQSPAIDLDGARKTALLLRGLLEAGAT
jgi:predicted glycosyltransferase